MNFGEKVVAFTHEEIDVAVSAFYEAINQRLRHGNPPLGWQVNTLRTLECVKGRRNHALALEDGNVKESPMLKGIFSIINEYVDHTSQSIARAVKTQPADSDLPWRRHVQGELAKRMVKEYEEGQASPKPSTPGTEELISQLSKELVTATGDDFRTEP